ncbi:5'-methylthioadenosine/adenosylhomocysteine nucleosidase [Sulfurimonas sp. MAG313]|nr:5'-methylthioadenosine/adenosylhomocysteine nucleosidase [Sulfurimonas sp. MAG313]MDF1879858.1 5'-methylthioadenosine/adenosylhomocysteine nucleosidase [Sulfurimonas sp. MAG313]
MKIAIMGAMPEETAPLLERVGEYTVHEFAGNKYYEATYKGHDLIIAYSKIGKVFSTLTATTMFQKFGAELLLFSGVAGAINPKLKIGDLIAATKLAQHDLDITAFDHPHGFVPEGKIFIEADASLVAKAMDVAKEMGLTLMEGTIATGDQFIADPVKNKWIGDTFNADALEMEGASVACVCDAMNIPFFILRAISDAADMDASFSFDKFLKSSAVQSANFIIKMVEHIE